MVKCRVIFGGGTLGNHRKTIEMIRNPPCLKYLNPYKVLISHKTNGMSSNDPKTMIWEEKRNY